MRLNNYKTELEVLLHVADGAREKTFVQTAVSILLNKDVEQQIKLVIFLKVVGRLIGTTVRAISLTTLVLGKIVLLQLVITHGAIEAM